MMTNDGTGEAAALPTRSELVEQFGFVRRIAGQLVRDASTADDVAQDAMIAALALEAAPKSGLRPWLYGVVRNLVRDRRKRSYTRRETSPVTLTSQMSDEDAVASTLIRGEHAEMVVRAVLALEDPYRTVVLMRYLEEVGPTEIAARLARPLATVETQLRRGLERVRTELDQKSGGDRSTWVRALAPLVASAAVRRKTSAAVRRKTSAAVRRKTAAAVRRKTAAAAMPGGTALAAAAVMLGLIAVVAGIRMLRPPAEPAQRGVATTVAATGEPPATVAQANVEGRAARSEAAVDQTAAPRATDVPARDAANEPQRHVRVIDRATGRAIAGAAVTLVELDLGQIEATTGLPIDLDQFGAGQFDVPPPVGGPPMGPRGAGPPGVPTDLPSAADLTQLLRDEGIDPSTFQGHITFDRSGKPTVVNEPAQDWVLENGKQVRYDEPIALETQTHEAATDGDGHAALPTTAADTTLVSVRAPGYVIWAQPVQWTKQSGPVVIELDGSGRIVVRRGALPPNTTLGYTLRHEIFSIERTGQLDSDRDQVRHEGLNPGEYTLDAVLLPEGAETQQGSPLHHPHALQVRTNRRVIVRRRGTTRVRAWDRTGPSLSVQVEGSPLASIEGAVLHAVAEAQAPHASWVDEAAIVNGVAELRDLPNAPIQLWVTTRAGRQRAHTRLEAWNGHRDCALTVGGTSLGLQFQGRAGRVVQLTIAGPLEQGATAAIVDRYLVGAEQSPASMRLDPLPLGTYEAWSITDGTVRVHRFDVTPDAATVIVPLDATPSGRS